MGKLVHTKKFLVPMSFSLFLIAGCASTSQSQPAANPSSTAKHPLRDLSISESSTNLGKVIQTQYDSANHIVTLKIQTVTPTPAEFGEDIVDLSSSDGVINYTTATYSNQEVKQVQVVGESATTTPSFKGFNLNVGQDLSLPSHTPSKGMTIASYSSGSISLPPPGARMDKGINPRAGLKASLSAKENAVLQVAQSKLNTPYIWGHNEDRGQYGFDCSNFTAYVYHHALGYIITSSSRGQAQSVGVSVPFSQIRQGDLLIFDGGAHVGIYSGNGMMIEEGGGLKKVGYLKVSKGSYWYNHMTSVKRMF